MKSKLLEMIALTFAYYNHGQNVQNEVLKMYADDLADLPIEKCIEAYKVYRRNPKNTRFPLPANIREIINPTANTRDLAINAANRVILAVSKFGWANPGDAKAFIGDAAWGHVERSGGWQYLCENLGVTIQQTTFMAQCRDSIASDLNLKNIGIDTDRPVLEQRSNQNLQLVETIKNLINCVDDRSDKT